MIRATVFVVDAEVTSGLTRRADSARVAAVTIEAAAIARPLAMPGIRRDYKRAVVRDANLVVANRLATKAVYATILTRTCLRWADRVTAITVGIRPRVHRDADIPAATAGTFATLTARRVGEIAGRIDTGGATHAALGCFNSRKVLGTTVWAQQSHGKQCPHCPAHTNLTPRARAARRFIAKRRQSGRMSSRMCVIPAGHSFLDRKCDAFGGAAHAAPRKKPLK